MALEVSSVPKVKSKSDTLVNGKTQSLTVLLRKLRRAKNLTQQKVSAHLSIAYQSYQQYENGRAVPPPEKLAKLADLFEVTTDYLLGREGGSLEEDSAPYLTSSDADLNLMGAKLAYHEIMKAVAGHTRKTIEFRKLLEEFRAGI